MERKRVVRDAKGAVVEVITEAIPALQDSTTGQEIALDEIERWFVTWGPLPEPNHFKGVREAASMSEAHAYAHDLTVGGVADVAVVGVVKQNRAIDDPVDAIAGKTLRKPAPSTFGFQGSTNEVQ